LTDQSWATVAGFLLSQRFQIAITPSFIRFDDPIWQSWDRVCLRTEDEDDPQSATVIGEIFKELRKGSTPPKPLRSGRRPTR
jgi:hypothetical protein